MSHVDDGRLHAYLDGALEHYPPDEAEAVREHLASCPECAARLEEARAVRDRSGAILDGALPDVGPLPDLEELRGEAGRRRGVRTRRSAFTRLGWAATVVVSLGAGWMARELTGPGGTPPAAPAGPPPVVEPTGSGETEDADAPPPPASAADTPAAPLAREPQETARTSDDVLATEPTEPEAEEEAVAGGARPATPEPTAADTGGGGALPQALQPPTVTDATRDATREAARAAATDAARERRDESAAAPARTVQLLDALETPLAPAHGPLGVEGLELLSVVRLPVAEGTVLRILQRLPRGDTLAVFHLLDGADPSTLPVLDQGRTELTLPTGEGWVVFRARRDAEKLRELARGLPR